MLRALTINIHTWSNTDQSDSVLVKTRWSLLVQQSLLLKCSSKYNDVHNVIKFNKQYYHYRMNICALIP